jgi:hypothetical protein
MRAAERYRSHIPARRPPVTHAATDLDGQRADVELFITARIRLAHTDAEHVAVFLRSWLQSLGLGHAASFPRGFLAELAAILRIALWQRGGLPADLENAFPPAAELLEQLIRGFIADPLSFVSTASGDRHGLRSQVESIWLARCAWTAPSELAADVWLGDIDEDLLVNALAEFLWTNRHKLRIEGKESQS